MAEDAAVTLNGDAAGTRETATHQAPPEGAAHHSSFGTVGAVGAPAEAELPLAASDLKGEGAEVSEAESRQRTKFLPMALVIAGAGTAVAAVIESSSPVLGTVFSAAAAQALRGGAAGGISTAVNIVLLMWLRTTMTYQYRFGGTRQQAIRDLWAQGGILRFYRGASFAMLEGPLARFGSFAANVLVLELRQQGALGLNLLPVMLVTMLGSAMAAAWRVAIMPIDVMKTVSQCDGKAGYAKLLVRVFREGQVGLLYTGAAALFLATLLGHYPWFLTFNYLTLAWPEVPGSSRLQGLVRIAVIGFLSSAASDVASNPLRVIKVSKQSRDATRDANSDEGSSYVEIVRSIVKQEGVFAMLTRGLTTRLLINALQSIVFTVTWRWCFAGK